MQLEEAIYQILKNDAGVTAIVSGRIFGLIVPQTVTYPLALYRSPAYGGMDRARVLEGGSCFVKEPIHMFSASKVKAEAARLDQAINTALDEYAGTIGDVEIEAIFSTRLAHAYDYDDATQVHQFVTEFECHYLDPLRAI